MPVAIEIAPGVRHYPGYLDRAGQEALRDEIGAVLAAAPPFVPRMPRTGKPFSVRMSNCGPLGWVSDEQGYRYQPTHPETGAPWPPMPARLMAVWAALAPGAPPPEACLINLYDATARMAPAPGPRRGGALRADRVAVARRHGLVPRRRPDARRADPLVPPRLRRRDDARRTRPAGVPRDRPRLRRRVDPARRRRADQPDDAAGDEGADLPLPARGHGVSRFGKRILPGAVRAASPLRRFASAASR